jgi:cytochrome bd-type quinol oxidase subunit 2
MKKVLSGIFIFIFILIAAPHANAGLKDAFSKTLPQVASNGGYDTSSEADIESSIANLINVFLSILGIIFVVLIIYSGVNWMTAGGQEKRVEESKSMLKQAIVGLIIVLGAYALSYFIINALSSGVAGIA